MKKIVNHRYFQLGVVVFFLIIMSLYYFQEYQENLKQKQLLLIQQALEQTNPYKNVATVAKSYSVFDITDNKIISGKNENESLPLASVTKIMTAFVALNALNIDDVIKIDRRSIKTEGESGFYIGQEFKLKDLIVATLVSSSNDGAYAIALAGQNKIARNDGDSVSDFIRLMNDKAQKIGMNNYNFNSVTGLDDNGKSMAQASAHDISILLAKSYMSYPAIFSYSSVPSVKIKDVAQNELEFKNTSELSGIIEGILMSKTGYTESAGGNLAVLYRANNKHIIAVVVLGSTREERFSDVGKLITTLEEYFVNQNFVINSLSR